MSFDSPWCWTDGQWSGFCGAFADPALEVEVFRMDVERHTGAEAKAGRARLALGRAHAFKPDRVYLSDGSDSWDAVVGRVHERLAAVDGLELAPVDRALRFADCRQRLRELEREVDAMLQLGTCTLAGATAPQPQVQRWGVDHIGLPDASFWIDRIPHDMLVSVTVSELEQGRAPGHLARAGRLGLQPSSSLLLSSGEVRRCAWEPT